MSTELTGLLKLSGKSTRHNRNNGHRRKLKIKMDKKIIAGIAAAATGLAAAATLAGSYVAYRMAFLTDREAQEKGYQVPDRYTEEEGRIIKGLIEELSAIAYKDVWIRSHDGLKLHGKYYHVAEGAPLEIQFHGYNGNSVRDFCGGNKIGREAGHNTLIVDQRAHGMSEGNTISFGIKERYDCLDWINYAIRHFGKDVKIILAGVSMGAATVLMATELDLPANVVCVVADCAYSSPEAIIKKVARDRRIPILPAFPFVRLGARIFGRFGLRDSSAVEAVKKSKVPILIIHGEEDSFVPFEMSKEIYRACNCPKAYLSVPGAGHGMSYVVDSRGYKEAVEKFLKISM